MKDPLIYGINELSESNNDNLECSCSFDNPQTSSFTINSTGKSIIRKSLDNSTFIPFDIGLIKEEG